MLSYKSNQNVQPLYDYYVETDLDSFDDQPVDYSKKYSDQDSYEDCRRRKSDSKSNEFSSVSQTVKQNCNDEVKVYCIEGTPLTISSASSFCDLREIGTSDIVEKRGNKDTLSPLPNDESLNSFEVDLNKSAEPLDCKQEESPLCKEKEDVKEVKSVSFRSGDDISKASSPLMFSRSSSVASLNSFEQQSIIDDRSSVSVFSALTSGLISPSDLPDSPGEMMSPALSDKTNSPKIDVTKPDSDKELDNLLLLEKDKIDLEKNVDNSINTTSDKMQCSKVEGPLTLDSYKSEDNLDDNELLNQQLELSNDSLDIDDVFSNPDYEDNSFSLPNKTSLNEEIINSDDDSDEDNILLSQCIQLGMPKNSNENKSNVKDYKKLEYQSHPQCDPVPEEIVKDNNLVKLYDDSDEDDALLQRCIQMGMPENTPNKSISDPVTYRQTRYSPHPTNYQSGKDVVNNNPVKLDDDSDEDDALLQRCIQRGMPENTPNKSISVSATYSQTRYSPHPSNFQPGKDIVKNSSPIKLDDDSDEDDALLQRCIQRGMPENIPNKSVSVSATYNQARYSPHPENFQSGKEIMKNSNSVKLDDDSDEDDALLQRCIQMGMPENTPNKSISGSATYRQTRYPPHPTDFQSGKAQNKNEREKSGESFHHNNNEEMSQFCMPLPYKLHEKIPMSSRPECALKNPLLAKTEAKNDLREGCPDGISDGDDEENLFEKCIRAGMPSPKMTNNAQNRPQNTILVTNSRKLILPNHHFLPDSNTEADKKFTSRLPPNQPYAPVHSSPTWISNTCFIDVDSMRIYRTEDTPILSPTASISDLSSLSFNESFLNNSRNSDCTSDSDDDDELLRQCIRSGMPQAKRAVA